LTRYKRCSLIAIALAFIGHGAVAAPGADIRLGPGDRLRVRAYDWRQSNNELHEWPALTGEFSVAASGAVFIPLAGEISATGMTPGALADAIAGQLQLRIGLAHKPDVSVEVAEFRPFYVLGRVNKAGQYPAKAGLTVLQAISVAGGFLQRADMSALELDRQIDVARGEIRALTAERLTLLGRRARIEAELHDSLTIDPPPEFAQWAKTPEGARVLTEEKLLLDARRVALHSQIDALGQTEALLSHEIDAQGEKRKSVERQIGMAKKELANVNQLVAKGLVVNARQLALEQNVSQFESNLSDIELLVLRAQQDLAKAGRDKADLSDKRRAEDLAELTTLSGQIATNMEKLQTALTLASDSELRGPQELAANAADQTPFLQFLITRAVDGHMVTKVASEDEIVQPGDTIRVLRKAETPEKAAALR